MPSRTRTGDRNSSFRFDALSRRRAVAFALTFALIVFMALEGGTYDVVIRQEVAAGVWTLIAAGALLGLLPRNALDGSRAAYLAAFAGLTAITALSLLWTSSAERTYFEIARVAGYGGFVVLGATAVNRYTWRAAAAGLAAAIGVVTLLALASRLFPDALPASPVTDAFDSSRLSYPLDYWNAVASWAAVTIAVGLAYGSHARSQPVRCLGAALVPAAILVTYLTYSRGGVIAAGVAVVAVIAFGRNRWTAGVQAAASALAGAALIGLVRSRPEIAEATGGDGGAALALATLAAGSGCAIVAAAVRSAGTDRLRLPTKTSLAIAPLALLLILVVVALGQDRLSDAYSDFKGTDQVTQSEGDSASRLTSSDGNRYAYWESAVDAFESAPLIGIGAGTYEFYWSENGSEPEYLRDAHSLYFEHLAEVGLIGGFILIVLLVSLFRSGLRARGGTRSGQGPEAVAFISVFVVWLVHAGVDWIWEVPALTAVALLGITIASAARAPRARPSGLWPRAALFVIALAAVIVQIPGIVSTERIRDAGESRLAGDSVGAIALADEAVAAAPWAATPRYVRARAELAAGDLDAAAADAEAASDREPDNLYHRILRTEIDLQRDRVASARVQFELALRLNGELPILNRFSGLRIDLERRLAEAEAAAKIDGDL